MSEMIYGNTGKRDEGINIDMEQTLYQKLQSVTFVPKLKKMLNDNLQSGDKNFVFIGEVQDKAGNFSVFGYNAKLENDMRGGDYGHYIAKPVDKKAASADFSNAQFLTEDGFIEYIYENTLNNEKKFSLGAKPIEVDINTKKRIVNNLMEAFTKARKRKNVCVSLDENDVDVFSEKSVSFLLDIMKYIPYRMRKNISFISHVNSIEKLPEMINLAVYSASCINKPHDCISLDGNNVNASDGIFRGYVEKVFSMSDSEREAYFEKLYNVIECPAIDKGVDIRSDLYLLDISTKELWQSGDVNEAIKNIFASTEDVLKIYPEYLELAKQTLKVNNAQTYEYVKSQVGQVSNTDELRLAYSSMHSLFAVCNFDFDKAVMPLITAKSSELIEKAQSGEEFVKTADAIAAINGSALDENALQNKIASLLCKKDSLNAMYNFYLTLKAKNYIKEKELDSCLAKAAEGLILKETNDLAESKEKLSKLEKIYTEFRNLTETTDFAPIQEVCAVYAKKFSGAASEEAVKGGNEIIYEIESDLRKFGEIWDIRGFIQKLAKIDVVSDSSLKKKTSDCYRKISDKLFKTLEYGNYTYAELDDFVKTAAPSVRALNEKGVYDRELRQTRSDEAVAFDGIYRLIGLFYALINGLNKADALIDALKVYETNTAKIEQHEMQIKKLCEKYGPVILGGWADKHPKINIAGSFDKTVKQLKKRDNISVCVETAESFKKCKRSGGKRKKSPLSIILICVIALVLISGAAVGGILIFNSLTAKEEVIEDKFITKETIEEIEGYLAAFNQEGFGEAEFIIGQIVSDSESENPADGAPADSGNGAVTSNSRPGDGGGTNSEASEGTDEEPAESGAPGGENTAGGDASNGTADEGASEGKQYKLAVTDSLSTKITDKVIEAAFVSGNENSKSLYSPDEADAKKNYAMVIQKKTEEDGSAVYYVYDMFALPDDLENYDFTKNYSDANVKGEDDSAFCSGVIQYVGYKKDLLKLISEPTSEPVETEAPSETTASSNPTEQTEEPTAEPTGAPDSSEKTEESAEAAPPNDSREEEDNDRG